MTLAKSIDAAREGLKTSIKWGKGSENNDAQQAAGWAQRALYKLAALPDQPLSREELIDIIIKAWHEGKNKRNDSRAANVIAALYNANVLFVEEK